MGTHDAQAALRRIMEEFVSVTRFIVICNYVSKIINPLHSRCSKFRFQPIGVEFQKTRILHIAKQENVKMGAGALDKLVELSKGDLRSAVTMLQTAQTFYDKVDAAALCEAACAVPEERIGALIKSTRAATSTDDVLKIVRNFLL